MKAIVKSKAEPGLWLEERPIPSYGDHDVLIKVEKTSICGTDLHLYEWDEWARKTLPLSSIIGHEFVGRIAATGKHVRGLKEGDRVSAEGHIVCGQCVQCRTGKQVLCPHTIGVGVNRDGCFAEYLAVPAANVFALPSTITDDMASLLDPLGNAVHTALMFDLIGKDVLITGAGPIGLMAIRVAQLAGARKVVISDINPYRLQLAQSLEPTAAVNVSETSLRKAMDHLGLSRGFDVCLEMSGSPVAFAEITSLLTHGGKIALLGILPNQAPIHWHDVIFKMITIQGIYGREIFKTWYQTCALLEKGLNIESVITHRYQAEEFQKGFDIMLSGKAGKVILDWTYLG